MADFFSVLKIDRIFLGFTLLLYAEYVFCQICSISLAGAFPFAVFYFW
jgi:hypothetical protein